MLSASRCQDSLAGLRAALQVPTFEWHLPLNNRLGFKNNNLQFDGAAPCRQLRLLRAGGAAAAGRGCRGLPGRELLHTGTAHVRNYEPKPADRVGEPHPRYNRQISAVTALRTLWTQPHVK